MNMCKGIHDLMEDSKAEGREEGRNFSYCLQNP